MVNIYSGENEIDEIKDADFLDNIKYEPLINDINDNSRRECREIYRCKRYRG